MSWMNWCNCNNFRITDHLEASSCEIILTPWCSQLSLWLAEISLLSCTLLQLAGGVVMAVGIWTLVEKSDYISLLSSKTYAASAYILVLAGAIVMVTGVLGCCATFKEQRRLLRVVRDHVMLHTAHLWKYVLRTRYRIFHCHNTKIKDKKSQVIQSQLIK